jgi:hypothetical protein
LNVALGRIVWEICVPTSLETENRASLARITCGWKKPELPLDWVRRYWRDVHSPAIARRAGVYDYRHSQFDAVTPDLLSPIADVGYACDPLAQLMWLSDVRYENDEGLNAFGVSPDGEVKAHLLGDIELIVDQSTTYRAVGENARTLIDKTGIATPQGAPKSPTFGLFFRQRGDEPSFRACVTRMAEQWAGMAGVLRLRLNLFEVPDMEAERKAGYPIKTHPVERQYQAWMELTLADISVGKALVSPDSGIDYAAHIGEIHAYPVISHYVFNYGGRPTLVGLRGYSAYEAIQALDAANQRQPSLLTWMYGDVVAGGPVSTGEA